MMEPSPKITVYVTNHNYGRFIKQAVESILNQTEQDFEIIIIDDGSTDNSREIITSFEKDPRIRTVFQNRKGLTVSNNIALGLARGRYIMRLDADDYLDSNALQLLSSTLDNDPEIGLVFGDWYLVDADGNVIGIERRHDFDKEVKLLDEPAHGACTLFRVEALRHLDGYDETLSRQDGYELWLRFIDEYKVKSLNIPIFYYRRHGENLTSDERKLLDTRAEILRKHAKRKQKDELRVVAIVPVRGGEVDSRSQPFLEVGGKPLIDYTLEPILQSQNIKLAVVTTPNRKLLDYINSHYDPTEVLAVERPVEMARINTSLQDTINHTLFTLEEKGLGPFDAFFFFGIETPFKRRELIDSAVNIAQIFDVDTVIGVRPEPDLVYQHNGKGLIPAVKQNEFLRLEREQLYRKSPGFTLRKLKSYIESHSMLGDRVGHVNLDQRSAFVIRSKMDLAIAEFLIANDGELAPGQGN